MCIYFYMGFPDGTSGKEPTCQWGRHKIPGSGRPHGGGYGNPFQYSCLEKAPGGAWWATVHRVTKSQTQLKRLSIAYTYFHTHATLFLCTPFWDTMFEFASLWWVCALHHFFLVCAHHIQGYFPASHSFIYLNNIWAQSFSVTHV